MPVEQPKTGTSPAQPSGTPLHLTAGSVELTVLPGDGGRIGSLRVAGTELLRTEEETEGGRPFQYGAFPMVPFAGRLRDGRFRNGAHEHQLPRNSGPHAIHGTGTAQPWFRTGPASVGFRLGAPWPYAGVVSQEFELTENGLRVSMMVESTEDTFPAQLGWHPWFRRTLAPASGRGGSDSLRVELEPTWLEERGDDHLPTGRRLDAPTEPNFGSGGWDDCFGVPDGLRARLRWPGALDLDVTSDCRYVVVYDEPTDAVCVEPQTGPPDSLNNAPHLVTPLEPLEATMRWSWTVHGAGVLAS